MLSEATPLPRALTCADVATMLHMSVGALAQLRFRGEGPAYVKIGRAVRYLESDVLDYITRARVTTRDSA